MFTLSRLATALTGLYIAFAGYNFYNILVPLNGVDLSSYAPEELIHPFWDGADDELKLKVYLSDSEQFALDFLKGDRYLHDTDGVGGDAGGETPPAVLIWEEILDRPLSGGDVDDVIGGISKRFVLSTGGDSECVEGDEECLWDESGGLNLSVASKWFDEQKDESENPFDSSYLILGLTKVKSFLGRLIPDSWSETETETEKVDDESLEVKVIRISPKSVIWSNLMSNRTVHVHALVMRNPRKLTGTSFETVANDLRRLAQSNDILLGAIPMIKRDLARPVKPTRILYHDLLYMFQKYVMGKASNPFPPWDLSQSQSTLYHQYQSSSHHKKLGTPFPYWKPEVSIQLVPEKQIYPMQFANLLELIQPRSDQQKHPSGYSYLPPLHVDEIGLTSEKYIAINTTVTALPLKVSFDSSSLSPGRYRLLSTMGQGLQNQKELGFDEEDIDDVRRLIAETNVTLLLITLLASLLHLLFEFLTFRSDVEFWRSNKDVTGLSIRSLFVDVVSQFIILLFLADKGSSLLVTGPCAVGVCIAVWKCQRGAGLVIRKKTNGKRGYEIVASRLAANDQKKRSDMTPEEIKKHDIGQLSMESDRLATKTIGTAMLPLLFFYAVYALMYEHHSSWYSYLVTTLSSIVYGVGFVFMTPQLFLNYKLKSVAHLPWKVLGYRFVNTFIDDLFAFIIRMPTMARISCFRDDVVFFIYLGQRWMYEVDKDRPVEGVGGEPGKEKEE